MFHRRAAIKLVTSTIDATRFQQEQEILASLDHPTMAKLLDAGVARKGWPYFVMEFVDGQPIHRWCEERKLNTNQRVALFGRVTDAVRYGHRDSKPSNICVTPGVSASK